MTSGVAVAVGVPVGGTCVAVTTGVAVASTSGGGESFEVQAESTSSTAPHAAKHKRNWRTGGRSKAFPGGGR
jgi:hypothetical protein